MAASSVLAIMAFYPVAQTTGQLTTSALKATERTMSYARWSMILSIPDLLLTYILLAPRTALLPGAQLGAVGLAIKTAIYGLVSVEVYEWLNCRFLRLSYSAGLARKLAAMLSVGALAFLVVNRLCSWALRAGAEGTAVLAVSSLLYATAVLSLIWLRPELAGLTREQLNLRLHLFRR